MNEFSAAGRGMSAEDGERFVQLFTQNQRRILAYIYSLVHHAQNAEDICQKTSLVLWRKFYQMEPGGDFLAWACRVAYLEVCNFRRVSARDRHCFSDELLAYLAEDRVADLPYSERRLSALRECVKQLSPPQRELLDRAYSSEESIRQLAGRLGQAVQTIYNRLFRIRRLLLDCVERRLGAEVSS
ncbi:MAG: sigma-70 family RNA polymerase sigma factor [Planctomycetota bacterium]